MVQFCGAEYADVPLCCTESQIDELDQNFATPRTLLSSCPACYANFVDFFCSFTCSPKQASFLNVTKTQQTSEGKIAVAEVDYLVSDRFGTAFYDSCANVKMSAINDNVMKIIGNGAKNYHEFIKYLGDEKPLGSPFQINFPEPAVDDTPFDHKAKNCYDKDYGCACVDCPDRCPTLPDVSSQQGCRVGLLTCWSFAIIIIYSVALVGFVGGYIFTHLYMRKDLTYERLSMDDDSSGPLFEQPRQYWLNNRLQQWCHMQGFICAKYPWHVIAASLVVVGILSSGWSKFQVETDPVNLWVAPDSEAAQQKRFFDESFGPFYRTEQMFISGDNVVSYDTLKWLFTIEDEIRALQSPGGVKLSDICFKPTGDACVVQSVTGYWQGDVSKLDPNTWKSDLQSCINEPVSCRPDFGQPLNPDIILGGRDVNASWLDSKALISTFVVANSLNETQVNKAKEWEAVLRDYLQTVEKSDYRVSYSTEISLQGELNKSTNTDIKIIVISYVVMFLYASFALGRLRPHPLVDSRFTLGLFGIAIVLMSVSASVGLFSFFGVKVTLIIAEVIPFFVLAVGVDNIFILVHEFDRHVHGTIEDRIARTLGKMGPSIILSATCETIAFALGVIVDMPAVRNFAIYAAGAIVIDALLQMTMFASALALDERRKEANRIDCMPALRVKNRQEIPLQESVIDHFIRKAYAPFLLRRRTKFVILAVFLGIFTTSLALVPFVQLGLDQRIAIPSDSHLIGYFNDLDEYFGIGPPVYFVTKDLNVTDLSGAKALCGRFPTCDEYSLSSILEQERKRPDVSYIDQATASWIDDFFLWLNPELESCCREKNGKLCDGSDSSCDMCYPKWNVSLGGMPQGQDFLHYLDFWLKSPTVEECTLAGQAAYAGTILADDEAVTIKASSFRTFHTPLKTQADFIAALLSARRIAETISENTGAEIFPYSVFYVFFDQYANIIPLAIRTLSIAFVSVFLMAALFLGSIFTALIIVFTILMIVADVAGVMAIWGISLNALSLVNIVICVGIGLEFCSHIGRAFMVAGSGTGGSNVRERDDRVYSALVAVGGSVFSGITVTKFLGIIVLAFTRSKIFEVYYFRMWLALIVLGALHGLVFLPVALSLGGGKGYTMLDSDEGDEYASRRYSSGGFLIDGADEEGESDADEL